MQSLRNTGSQGNPTDREGVHPSPGVIAAAPAQPREARGGTSTAILPSKRPSGIAANS